MKSEFLKRIAIVAIAVVTMSVAVQAQQQGDMAAGGHLAYWGEDGFSSVGIGGKFRYNITDPIRLEGSFTFFLPKKFLGDIKMSMWDLSVNGHYLFPVSDKVTLYPLAGLSILGFKSSGTFLGIDASHSETKLFLNIGGGVDFNVADNIAINLEPKLIVGDGNAFILSAGVVFKF